MKKQIIVIIAFLILLIQRVITIGILIAVKIFPSLLKTIKERVEFEELNESDLYGISFRTSGIEADVCFEVSSEGEYQQVAGIIEDLLNNQKHVEIIYCSPSLESNIEKLKTRFSAQNLRIIRLPILKIKLIKEGPENLGFWVTASKFVFVRYDFFPNLIYASMRNPKRKVYLVWASLKGKLGTVFSKALWRDFYNCFDALVTPLLRQRKLFREIGIERKCIVCEFRVTQIMKRLEMRQKTFEARKLTQFIAFLESSEKIKSVFGSCYVDDIESLKEVLAQAESRGLNILAPHSLSEKNIADFERSLKEKKIDYHKVDSDDDLENMPLDINVILLTAKGVLCELYSYGDFGYVGGGFERSVHSLLEPFVSGIKVFCGPLTHRSTEYDYILERYPHLIEVIEERSELASRLQKDYSSLTARKDKEEDKQELDFSGEKQERLLFISELIS